MSVCSKILEIKKRVSESDIGYRMASGAFWSFTGTALAKAVVVIAGILCARVLGKEIYGQYGLVKSIITTFMVIGGSGLGFTATKYIAEYRREHKERIASIYFVTNGFAGVMAILVSLLLYIFSDFLATTVLHTPPFAYTLRLASFILIVVVVNLAQEGVLSGFEDFRGKAISSFIGSLVQAIGLLSFAYFWGLNGAVIGNGLGLCSIAIINKFFINKDFKIHSINRSIKNVHKEDWKLLYRFRYLRQCRL